MHCLKCGTEVTAPDVFCPECQAEMEKDPVPRDTPVFIPAPAARSPRKAYTPYDPDKQIAALNRQIRRQRVALWVAISLCAALLVMLFFAGSVLHKNTPSIGQNYQSSTSPSATTSATQEAATP